MGTESAASLNGLRVLVTRPAHQAQGLCDLIESAGGHALRFPLLEIAPPSKVQVVDALLGKLKDFDLAIFVSANAVRSGFARLRVLGAGWPEGVQCIAVGSRTARAMEDEGLQHVLSPRQGFNSEALLAMPELIDVQGRRVMIFRGEGGREVLADTLRARGAEVVYAEVYRRDCPDADGRALFELQPDIIIVTSQQAVKNLLTMGDGDDRARLLATGLLAISPRVADFARRSGFASTISVSAQASDEGLLQALGEFSAGYNREAAPPVGNGS